MGGTKGRLKDKENERGRQTVNRKGAVSDEPLANCFGSRQISSVPRPRPCLGFVSSHYWFGLICFPLKGSEQSRDGPLFSVWPRSSVLSGLLPFEISATDSHTQTVAPNDEGLTEQRKEYQHMSRVLGNVERIRNPISHRSKRQIPPKHSAFYSIQVNKQEGSC